MSLLQRYNSLKEAAHLTLSEVEGLDLLADSVLTQVVLEAIRTYQQKLAVGIEDSASDLLDTFKLQVAKHIFETAAGWRVTQRDNFLFPHGCRFCFTRGPNTIVVIEQGPQTRSLSFVRGMQREETRNSGADSSERVSLALPYSIFILSFRQDGFQSMRYLWRTAPLKSLDDMLCVANLPNLHEGGTVCLGRIGPTGTTISETCENCVAGFWNSQFNHDLSAAWWHKDTVSPQIATGKLWAENSINNPLFILGLPFAPYKTVREVLDIITASAEEPSESVFRHKLSEQIDGCVEALFHKMTSYLKKTKFDKHSPNDIHDALKSCLKTSVSELVDVSMAVHHEIDKLGEELKEPILAPEPAGPFWNVYH